MTMTCNIFLDGSSGDLGSNRLSGLSYRQIDSRLVSTRICLIIPTILETEV